MNLRLTVFAAAVLAGAAVVSQGASANLLNGSFENTTGFVDNTGGDAMVLNQGSTTMTGWTVIGGGTLLWAGPGSSSYMGGLQASNGGYFLDLTGLTNQCSPPNNVCAGVSQSVNTIVGGHYELTFDFSGRGDSIPAEVQAIAGSTSGIFTTNDVGSSASSWATGKLDFTATSSSTLISLVGYFDGGNGLSLNLDNINLVQIPEPISLSLFGSGLLAAGAFRHRKKKSA